MDKVPIDERQLAEFRAVLRNLQKLPTARIDDQRDDTRRVPEKGVSRAGSKPVAHSVDAQLGRRPDPSIEAATPAVVLRRGVAPSGPRRTKSKSVLTGALVVIGAAVLASLQILHEPFWWGATRGEVARELAQADSARSAETQPNAGHAASLAIGQGDATGRAPQTIEDFATIDGVVDLDAGSHGNQMSGDPVSGKQVPGNLPHKNTETVLSRYDAKTIAEAPKRAAGAQPLPDDAVSRPAGSADVSASSAPHPDAVVETSSNAIGVAGAIAADSAPLPPRAAAAAIAGVVQPTRLPCTVDDINIEPQEAGMMRLSVRSPCRAGQAIAISYGAFTMPAKLDESGIAEPTLDLFQGAGKSVTVTFADGNNRVVAVRAKDLDRVVKVALIWEAPVTLKLHVFEYGASFGSDDHIWDGAPSGIEAVRNKTGIDRRGHGFMSSKGATGGNGVQFEVYTFVHANDEATGTVTMALDYETRGLKPTGETCGSGKYARLEYRFVVLGPQGEINGGTGVLRSLPCNVVITEDQRYQQAGLPTLRLPEN